MNNLQELATQVAQLKAYLVTMAEHQILDQKRIALLEQQVGELIGMNALQEKQIQGLQDAAHDTLTTSDKHGKSIRYIKRRMAQHRKAQEPSEVVQGKAVGAPKPEKRTKTHVDKDEIASIVTNFLKVPQAKKKRETFIV